MLSTQLPTLTGWMVAALATPWMAPAAMPDTWLPWPCSGRTHRGIKQARMGWQHPAGAPRQRPQQACCACASTHKRACTSLVL